MLRKTPVIAAAAALALGLGACGDDDDYGGGSAAQPTQTQAAPTGGTSAGGTTLRISADPDGQLAFQQKALTAKAGPVTVAFTNDSPVSHDVVIETTGAEEEDVAETETISKSSTQTTADLQAGRYVFYCDVGSHREAGMEGTLTVK